MPEMQQDQLLLGREVAELVLRVVRPNAYVAEGHRRGTPHRTGSRRRGGALRARAAARASRAGRTTKRRSPGSRRVDPQRASSGREKPTVSPTRDSGASRRRCTHDAELGCAEAVLAQTARRCCPAMITRFPRHGVAPDGLRGRDEQDEVLPHEEVADEPRDDVALEGVPRQSSSRSFVLLLVLLRLPRSEAGDRINGRGRSQSGLRVLAQSEVPAHPRRE